MRALLYFKHGYGEWFSFPLGLMDKVVLLFIALKVWEMDGLSLLAIVILATSILGMAGIVITLIGRWDYWKGQVPESIYIHPYTQDTIRALIYHFMGRDEDAAKILEKWRDIADYRTELKPEKKKHP
jgi:hypothetical protein